MRSWGPISRSTLTNVTLTDISAILDAVLVFVAMMASAQTVLLQQRASHVSSRVRSVELRWQRQTIHDGSK